MRRSRILVLTTLALLAAAGPAAAAGKAGTWWVAADGWFAEPTGADLDVAFKQSGALVGGGGVETSRYDSDFSGRIRAGWRESEAGGNGYSVSYWTWKDTSSYDESGVLNPIVSDPFFGFSFADRVRADGEAEATILDLALSRRMVATKKSSWSWTAGLRYASFEQSWDVENYDSALVSPGPVETVAIDLQSQGWGMTLGFAGQYLWHPRIRTYARAQAGLIQGRTDATYHDRGFDTFSSTFLTTAIERDPGESRIYQQLDMEARVIFNVWKTLDVSLGYQFFNWDDAGQADRFLDDIKSGPVSTSGNVAFSGWVLGVSYVFD